MFVDPIQDRFRGCLLGLAIGDAIGAQVEFQPREYCVQNPVTDMTGGGPWRLEPGMWTDDTSQAFALAASLVERGVFDAADVMERFVDWRQGVAYGPSDGRGCFDIGGTTAAALSRFATDGNPFAGIAAEFTAANGCLMRLAPVAMFAAFRPKQDRLRLAADSARLTHAEPRCTDCTAFLAELLADWMVCPTSIGTVIRKYDAVTGPLRDMLAAQNWKRRESTRISSSGYVLATLEAAMWAVYGSTTFRNAILRAVNLGGDADTVGAVAGQIAGAYYGYESIPLEWRGRVDRGVELLKLADSLYELATSARRYETTQPANDATEASSTEPATN